MCRLFLHNKKVCVFLLTLLLAVFNDYATARIINDYNPVETPAKIKQEYYEDILDFQYAYIWRLYNNDKDGESGKITMLLFNMVLLNPEINLDQFKEVIAFCDKRKKLSVKEAKGFLEDSGKDNPYIIHQVEARLAFMLAVIKKNYGKALDLANEDIKWENKEFIYRKQRNTKDYVCQLVLYNIVKIKSEISIIHSIIARKSKKLAVFPQEILDFFWKYPYDYSQGGFQRFLTTLIVYNKTAEFKKVFDRYPLESLRWFFRCKQRAEVYYEWFYQHSYWLTPEFKKLIEEIRPVMLAKIDDCAFAKRLKKKKQREEKAKKGELKN